MVRPRPPRRDPLAALRQPATAALAPRPPAESEPGGAGLVGQRVFSVALDELFLESQPREIVPEEELQQLIAAGRARPGALLAALQRWAADDAYYAELLAEVTGLGRSIAAQGVLQPVEVVVKANRYILRDGHRRSLAALLAGLTSLPAIEVVEPSDVEGIARAFVVNLQRRDLTAIEKGAALLRLALVVGRRLADEGGDDPATITLAALIGGISEPESPAGDSDRALPQSPAGDSAVVAAAGPVDAHSGEHQSLSASARGGATLTGLPRELAAAIRERVCALTGLSRKSYYDYLALNRLTPAARPLARGLSEGRLRPIVAVAPERQRAVLAFAEAQRLSEAGLRTLCSAARAADADEIGRVMERLAAERTARPSRTAVSWEGLLSMAPEDYGARLSALRAELSALPPRARARRLEQLRRQIPRLQAILTAFEELGARYAEPAAVQGRRRPTGD